MAEKITSINPSMLQWARAMSGTTIEEVGEKIGGSDKIISWEKGEDYPTYSQLKRLCDIYRKPIAVFFFPEPPQTKNLPASCRTLPENIYNNFSRKLIKAIDEARVMQLNLYELNNNENPSEIKFTNIIFNYKNIKNVAFELRKMFSIDLNTQKRIRKLEEAFELWRECFYRIGIYVFKNAFRDETVSGFCLYDNEFPIICINNSFAPARQIFTLFHEMYHLICQTSGIDLMNDSFLNKYDNLTNAEIEYSCNHFSGEFLVPDHDFDMVTKNEILTDELINRLSKSYCVSREVILRKFLDRNKISQDQYLEKREEYNSDYFRIKEKQKENGKSQGDYYNTQAVYKGQHYLELAYNRYYEQKITITQLSRYLNMKIPSIEGLASRKGWGALQ
jgi:Zn-dependent peptidase ImmA (M78 family)/DNA-binding XRE family transcriptional regulator